MTTKYNVVLVNNDGRRVVETTVVGLGKDDKLARADAMRQARSFLRNLHYKLEARS